MHQGHGAHWGVPTEHIWGLPAACHCQKGQPSHSPLGLALPHLCPSDENLWTNSHLAGTAHLLLLVGLWQVWSGQAVSVGASFQHLEEIKVSHQVWAGQSSDCSTWSSGASAVLWLYNSKESVPGYKSLPPFSRIHSAAISFSLCRAPELRWKNSLFEGREHAPLTLRSRGLE